MSPHFETREERIEGDRVLDEESRAQADRIAEQTGGRSHSRNFWTRSVKTGKILGYGYQDNGIFCTLRCGYRWALRVIESAQDKRPHGLGYRR